MLKYIIYDVNIYIYVILQCPILIVIYHCHTFKYLLTCYMFDYVCLSFTCLFITCLLIALPISPSSSKPKTKVLCSINLG